MAVRELIIKDTHRGLYYEDGVLTKVLEAGRYRLPRPIDLGFYRRPRVEVALVDLRERDLTIKGQEILTADKVAIRISIIVQFRVVDPKAAIHEVATYEDRLYTDVQLAARRSLAAMTLDEILTDRNRLSEDIQRDVYKEASSYGVAIRRADVKDLIFPGNLQEIMNKVLAAERTSQAQLVEARTRAQTQMIEADARAESSRRLAESQAESERIAAVSRSEAAAPGGRVRGRGGPPPRRSRRPVRRHPAMLRLRELETLRDLSKSAAARVYVDFVAGLGRRPATIEQSRPIRRVPSSAQRDAPRPPRAIPASGAVVVRLAGDSTLRDERPSRRRAANLGSPRIRARIRRSRPIARFRAIRSSRRLPSQAAW
ncbi:MAG: slipin family protein [Isosphaeraceae bacterium]